MSNCFRVLCNYRLGVLPKAGNKFISLNVLTEEGNGWL